MQKCRNSKCTSTRAPLTTSCTVDEVKCYIGFCTPTCTEMDSKKKLPAPLNESFVHIQGQRPRFVFELDVFQIGAQAQFHRLRRGLQGSGRPILARHLQIECMIARPCVSSSSCFASAKSSLACVSLISTVRNVDAATRE